MIDEREPLVEKDYVRRPECRAAWPHLPLGSVLVSDGVGNPAAGPSLVPGSPKKSVVGFARRS